MSFNVDDTLAAIQVLSTRIAALEPGPDREALEVEREELRAAARLAADIARPLNNLEAELANVEEQLAEMGEVAIKPALNESYKLITDPSAYRRKINESIESNEAARHSELEQRRAELEAAVEAHHERR